MSILRILYMQMPESAPFLFPDISRQSYVLMLSRLFQDDAKVRIICNICKFLLGYPIYDMGRTEFSSLRSIGLKSESTLGTTAIIELLTL